MMIWAASLVWSLSKKLGDYGLSLKYANYSDGDSSFNKADAEKLWLTVSAAF